VAQASTHSAEAGGAVQASNATREPRASAADRGSTTSGDPREPRRLPQEDEAIDIMDLPPSGSRSANKRVRPTVERTSYRRDERSQQDVQDAYALQGDADNEDVRSSASRQAPTVEPPGKPVSTSYASYGHDPDYAWLKGQLEYSNIDRRWKLRYIPIDGKTDEHGGSVVLPESPLLDSFQPGDFIAVQGALAGKATSGYAPLYDLSRVKRLEP
jgi:hypothetical protein